MHFKKMSQSNLIALITFLTVAIGFFIVTALTHTNVLLGGAIYAGDLPDQYLSFFQNLRSLPANHFSGLTYSFSNGLGGSMIGNWSYYLLSPFNLLIFLFPAKGLYAAVYIIIWIKLSLAGATFSWAAEKLFDFSHPLFAVTLGLCYALCGWNFRYFANLMWLDSICLLPLLVYFLHLMLTEHKGWLAYCLLLACALIFNYYTGYMICLFLIVFALTELIINFKSWKFALTGIVQFAVGSIISGLLSAWILLPTWLNLRSNKLTQADMNHPKLANTSSKILSQFFLGRFQINLPAVFISTFALLGFILYFCSSHISLRAKLVNCLVGIFLFGSLMAPNLYLLWHGGQNPVSFPYRFVFIIVFWMLFISAQAFSQDRFELKQVAIAAAILLSIYLVVLATRWKAGWQSKWFIAIGLLIIVLTWLLLNTKYRWTRILLVTLTGVELLANGVYMLKKAGLPVNSYANYVSYNQNFFHKLPKNSLNQRLGKNYLLNNDRGESFAFGYHGAEIFSSNNDHHLSDFYQQLGMNAYGYYYFYQTGTRATDALLGIKTFVNDNNADSDKQPELIRYGLRDDLTEEKIIHKNKRLTAYNLPSFPIGWAGPLADNISYQAGKVLDNQNEVLNAITQSKQSIFKSEPQSQIASRGCRIVSTANYQVQTKLTQNKNSHQIEFLWKGLQPKQIFYLVLPGNIMDYPSVRARYYHLKNKSSVQRLLINNQPVQLMPRGNQPIGVRADNNGQIKLLMQINPKLKKLKLQRPELFSYNASALNSKIKFANKHEWSASKLDNHELKGQITVKSGQALVTTIPAAAGWQAVVDGKKVPTAKCLGVFLAVKLKPGHHQVQLSYHLPGLKLGICLTLVGMLALGYLMFVYKKVKARKIIGL